MASQKKGGGAPAARKLTQCDCQGMQIKPRGEGGTISWSPPTRSGQPPLVLLLQSLNPVPPANPDLHPQTSRVERAPSHIWAALIYARDIQTSVIEGRGLWSAIMRAAATGKPPPSSSRPKTDLPLIMGEDVRTQLGLISRGRGASGEPGRGVETTTTEGSDELCGTPLRQTTMEEQLPSSGQEEAG